jgi:sugar lactone lactonase YvrE
MLIAPPAPRHEAEVLIAEARHRQRRRRWAIAIVVVITAIAALTGWALTRNPQQPRPPAGSHLNAQPGQGTDPTLTLSRPASLTAGPHGLLYIADDSRNMIFARHSDGRITVVAGTGTRGYSGDGHLAIHAQLNDPAGMIYDTETHTLYVADSGNNRVRAIDSHGTIRTVVGSGRHEGWAPSGTQAFTADLPDPAALAISQSGQLYATNGSEVVRLNPSGTLTHIAGTNHGPQGVVGIGGPASHASVDGADGLAFDGRGDLYLTGTNTKALLVITPTGQIRDVCPYCLYPRGNAGIVTAPNGHVIAMAPLAIYRYPSLRTRRTVINFAHTGPIGGIHGVSPAGIAILPNGAVFIDTNPNGGYSNAAGIIKISAVTTRTHVVWRRS